MVEIEIIKDIWVKPLDSIEKLIPKGSKVKITQNNWKYAFYTANGSYIGSFSEGMLESIKSKERVIFSLA